MGSLTERMSRFAASRTLTRHTSGLLRPSPPGPNSPSTTAPTTSKKMSSAVQTPPYATDSSRLRGNVFKENTGQTHQVRGRWRLGPRLQPTTTGAPRPARPSRRRACVLMPNLPTLPAPIFLFTTIF